MKGSLGGGDTRDGVGRGKGLIEEELRRGREDEFIFANSARLYGI